jgi:hypothetical protein
VAGVLCATAALPGRAAAAGPPDLYAFAEGARTVEGTPTSTGSVRLAPAGTYRSSLGEGGELHYRLELDGSSNAYVSVTAVPEPGTTVASQEGIEVSLRDADNHRCSSQTARFGPARSPRPVTAWASREIGSDPYMCQGSGTYYVVVERVGRVSSSQGTPDTQGRQESQDEGDGWALELVHVLEPPLKRAGPTNVPETWNSASPQGLTGEPERRKGGAGFATASPVAQGVWEAAGGIRAGQTLFYKVSVDWGQQLHVTAELGSAGADYHGFVGAALVTSLYNPVRGLADAATSGYDGRPRSVDLHPLPPVRYANRFALDNEMSATRFAGWYYLAVHLGAPVAERFGDGPFALTLRVRVAGTAGEGPGYLGASQPQGVFQVTEEGAEAAEQGPVGGREADGTSGGGGESGAPTRAGGSQASDSTQGLGDNRNAMRLAAVGGIGTGCVLVLGLALWTVLARRRAKAVACTQAAATRNHRAPRGW